MLHGEVLHQVQTAREFECPGHWEKCHPPPARSLNLGGKICGKGSVERNITFIGTRICDVSCDVTPVSIPV